ncbi:hypothetical protein A6A27_31935 [Micromonospora sp. CB01531]|nr:hypothetical protein A6A27_31935 [Micromonospora sp. CB01531]
MFQRTGETYAELPHGKRILFLGHEGTVFKADGYARHVSPAHVAVVLHATPGIIHHVHQDTIEVWEEPKPEPPTPQYTETEYYQCTITGAVYKRQFNGFEWHLICIGSIRPSIKVTSCDSSNPEGFKRLYKEV